MVSVPLSPSAPTLTMSAMIFEFVRLMEPLRPVCRMSIDPRSARMESGGGPPPAEVEPVTLMALFGPVARIVILPPGPGAAASSNESSWPVLLTFMATPVLALLCILILPQDRLFRCCGSGATAARSAEETVMAELTVIPPAVEFRFTVPPLPLGSAPLGINPLVAWIGEPTVIAPVALTSHVPPPPAGVVVFGLLLPLKVTDPWILSAGGGTKVSDCTL